MPSTGQFAPHGLIFGATPGVSLESEKDGKMVIPPVYGARGKLAMRYDPMAFSAFMDDFFRFEEDAGVSEYGGWLATTIGNAPTLALDAAYSPQGAVLFTTDDTADGDGGIVQWMNCNIGSLVTSHNAWFSARVKLVGEAANVDLLVRVGVCVAATANPFSADPQGAFFTIADGVLGAVTKNASGTTTSATLGTLAVNTWYELSFKHEGGTTLVYYLDRVPVATVSAYVPVGIACAPFFAGITATGGAGAVKTFALDFVSVVQQRYES